MKKIVVYFLFVIASYFPPVAVAAECADLNGVWKGQLGELSVALKINIAGFSSVDFKVPGGGGSMIGKITSTCQMNEGVPNLKIWHEVRDDKGRDWYLRVIVDGSIKSPNALTIKTFKYLDRLGGSESGSGILYK